MRLHESGPPRAWRFPSIVPGRYSVRRMSRAFKSMILTWNAIAIAAISGCEPRSGTASAPVLPGSSGSGALDEHHAVERPNWPYWPVAMRLHPLTRLMTDAHSGETIIEARLEFVDGDSQTTKAVGQLTLQVYPDSVTPTGSGALETWNQDLRDVAVNRRQYDDVTRTYLFRLQATQALPAGCEIRAFFLSADDRRMNAEMRLRQ
jgi:hypothetical protein